MRLTEHDGKALLRRHGIAVPRGVLLRPGEPVPEAVKSWPGLVAKAQILAGGRGKRGLVRVLRDAGELAAARQAVAASLDSEPTLLLEEVVPIAREIYVAVRVDGTRQALELLIAAEGGEDVERRGSLRRLPVEPGITADALFPALAKIFPSDLAARLARFALRLSEIARAEDLYLLEINPLAVTKSGELVACDAKLVTDDSAEFRHDPQDLALSDTLGDMTLLEREAHEAGFQLVELPGSVALVSSGAGLGMMMVDLLADHGLSAACFMDNRRGGPADTTPARLRIAAKIARRPEVKAICFQTVVASRSLAERVNAILAWIAAEKPPKPLFIGIAAAHVATKAMSVADAAAKLGAAGAQVFSDPIEMVRAMAKAVAGRS